jgi:hypothetical protein
MSLSPTLQNETVFYSSQAECPMPLNVSCNAVPHNVLKSLVLVFLQALGINILRYHNISCALTDEESVAGSTACSFVKTSQRSTVTFTNEEMEQGRGLRGKINK